MALDACDLDNLKPGINRIKAKVTPAKYVANGIEYSYDNGLTWILVEAQGAITYTVTQILVNCR